MMSSSVMANIGSYRWLLTGLMVGSVLVFSDQLLDYYHHSRFLFLSVIVFFFSIVLFICKRDKRLEFHSSKIGWALIGFAALNILSITWAAEKAEALFYTEKWIYAACLFYLLLWTFLERQENEVSHFIAQLARVTTTIILVVVFIPLINVIQKDGISNEALYQVKTMFGHKSLTSLFLFLLLPLNLLDKFERNFTWPVLLLVLCQILMILVLQSRAVYLSLFVFILIVGSHVFHYRTHWSPFLKKKYILPAVLIMVGAFVFLLQNDGFRERLNMLHYLKSQTSTERQDVWRMTKPLIREHWIMGVGPGNWKLQFPGHGVEGSYRMQDQNVFFTRAHNDFLEIFAELGLLGFSIYVFLFGYAFYQLHLARHKSPWKSRMLLAGMIGYLISSLIDFPKERLEFVTILILYLAVVESISAKKITKSLSPYFLMLITF
ncbi:MAG: O-antigen ligase family protein, partial [Saprospiraceae bacterium]|nr:O-antigen ligase family protein [Saprospiraceae bacterium]